ncbi:MAG TPA: nucleotidyltransferase domain-containing protein [Lacunisphaera sp.]|nr:nucleotidyltransferase domain-containing protein [Lacunisphaera sp.]
MDQHHVDTIDNVVRHFRPDPSVRALLLGGSLVHGFARPESDIDVAIVVSADEFARRRAENRLTFFNRSLCTYPGGYVDGKFMDLDFLRQVAERGSEPARYAFDGVKVLFSDVEGLAALVARIVRYPTEGKADRIARFAAQLVGWRWFFSEGTRKDNRYLQMLAVQKVVLFSCRMVLAANELLYPFHKWMLRVTLAAPRQPAGFGASIERVLASPTFEVIDGHVRTTLAFVGLDHDAVDATWGANFMRDTELKWMAETPAIDDW